MPIHYIVMIGVNPGMTMIRWEALKHFRFRWNRPRLYFTAPHRERSEPQAPDEGDFPSFKL
jgi:hypothetical protein